MDYYRNTGYHRDPRTDHRFLIGRAWWSSSLTKYNKDGSVYRRPSGPPGRFYTWFVLKPVDPKSLTFKIMIGFLVVIIIVSFILAF